MKKRTKEYTDALSKLVQAKFDIALREHMINGTPMPTAEELARDVVGMFEEERR